MQFTYKRRYSFFAPEFTYAVTDVATDRWIGEVARMGGDPHQWWASNKTWTGGGDLVHTFATRTEAAQALLAVANGTPVETFGGYDEKEN